MEIPSPRWLSEIGMEDPVFDCLLDDFNFDQILSDNKTLNSQVTSQNNIASPVSTETTESSSDLRPQKQQKTNNWNSFGQDLKNRKPSRIISFDNSNSRLGSSEQCKFDMGSDLNLKYRSTTQFSNKKADVAPSRTPMHALDHILAEKKRREKISESFIALSAVIPGLKKTNKASILGEALRYVKQLEGRVTKFQDQAAKQSMESAVILKKTHVYVDDDSRDEGSNGFSDQPLPDIDARVSDKKVLIRIHCENRKGCLVSILNQIEKLGLSVINNHVLPFGNSTLSITVVAQMETNYCMTMKDLLKSLRLFLLKT